MKEGKLPYNILEKFIDKYRIADKSMIVGPGIGIDCAVFDSGADFILATSDPVTYVSSGKYCINVNVNDIAAMGGDPWFFTATILIPPDTEESILEVIMDEIKDGCEKYNINFAGGHTEISSIVTRPVISGFLAGKCEKNLLRGAFNAKDGDILLLTKGVSIEGTSIIAEKKNKEIVGRFGIEFYKKCIAYRDKLSVLTEAKIARESANAMHDITEGGLVNGLYEIAAASDVSIELHSLPVLPECKILCDIYNLNPLGLIASGSLAITTKNKELKKMIEKEGVETYEIGTIVKDGRKELRYNNSIMKIFDTDEITKVCV